nr:reverse transcriptase domain-containing protein [Tanacetum cinerariifolium]
MDKAFEGQVGRNIEVYVDDLVVKSHTKAEMVRDIEETFHTLHKVNMKLNPKKCSFGLAEGVFLRYVVTPEGIKPCPDKTAAVRQLPSPRTIKEVQILNEKLAILNRFLSRSAEKSLPLFQTSKKCIKKSDFHWTTEAEQAFQQLKQHLSELPLLCGPDDRARNDPYANLLYKPRVTESGTKLLANGETGFVAGLRSKKTLEVFSGTSYHGHHLSAHQAGHVSSRRGRTTEKWSIMLGEHNITYRPRTSVKGQILADFLIEMPGDASQAVPAAATQEEPWTLFTDGSSCVDGSGILPGDEKEARKIRLKARQYELMERVLYKRSFLTPWLRCVGPLQANYVMREIHEGSCSMHAGSRAVVAKAMRIGYYWPTMHKDALDMIRKCSDFQVHRLVARHPQQSLTPITAPWLFYKWGIDIVGPFSEGPGKVKFLIVAMDYFTKWIEAKAVATITCGQVKKFVWDNIVCRFGIPGEIISDNGKQFADNPFKDWCDKLNITQRFASVKHLQSNGLVERANRSLGEGIKTRLGEGNKNWVEELPHVLWAHRTMIKSSHGDTPFSLTYGTEAVIPAEIGMPTYRTAVVDVVNNDEELRLNLDFLEEHRELAAISEAKSKSKMIKYYNARVRGVAFKP